jgi:ABC-type nitrate/sulfonate/bicarbonate transport system substrate-binding protein
MMLKTFIYLVMLSLLSGPLSALGADKLIGIHSARVMSQSMPWIAQEAGLFKKYNLDFQLVFISSSGMVTAALLGGDAEMTLTGGVGNVRAYVKGATDVVFVAGVKNVMTQSILAGANVKRPEDLKGKRIGVPRVGGNSHYFTIQALRRFSMEPERDYAFIQTGGEPESLAALIGGGVDAATMTALRRLWSRPTDSVHCHELRHEAFCNGQKTANHRAIFARLGRGVQDHAHG